ncbi:MAG: cysteine synthase family protein [Planctomycetes bacterium]|nr:cysteine synthase family protein [Planctomycetota bacterium]
MDFVNGPQGPPPLRSGAPYASIPAPGEPPAGRSVLAQIGNTPLLALHRVTVGLGEVRVCAKAEWFNPGGSVKDRAALRIVEDAEAAGRLTPDRILLDSTSGNTGIALAMIGAVKGYRVQLVMPASVSEERKRIVLSYGAEVSYTEPMEGSDGALREVRRRVEADPDRYFYANQYDNPSNWRAHHDGTAVEIWRQTGGRVTHFVAALGTTGTFTGTARRLKALAPGLHAASVQPATPIHGIEGLKHLDSAIVPGIHDPALADEELFVETEEAYEMAKRLAREEGILAGYSAGAALAGALRVARRLERGLVVTVFPDGGDRYLSTTYWGEELARAPGRRP